MKKKTIIPVFALALCSLMACAPQPEQNREENLSQYVEPRIGTAHCRWFHFAPGALPFGLAKPGPSTNGSLGNKGGWEATGYDYRDTSIEGFPCLHEFQVGGIVLMPTNGELVTVPGSPADSVRMGYRSAFDHADETVHPGYYSVLLKDYNIQAELTATKRVAFQRFSFPAGKEAHILFDIGNRQGESGPVRDAFVQQTADGRIEGWVITEPVYVSKYQPGATVPLYFSAQLDKQPDEVGAFHREKQEPNAREARGVEAGLYLTYNNRSEPFTVTAKVGLSYTSVENARNNLETEARTLTFDEAQAASAHTWEEYLSRIRVETDVREDKVKLSLSDVLTALSICAATNPIAEKAMNMLLNVVNWMCIIRRIKRIVRLLFGSMVEVLQEVGNLFRKN